MDGPTITEHFGEFIEGFDGRDLNANQAERLKLFLLDWIGSAIAGQNQKPVRIFLDLIREFGGPTESTVFADGSRKMSLFAALANGASSHVVEMDDLHRESILHPAAAIMPAVVAIAEREKVTGARLLAGIAMGYEIGIRVALGAGPSHYHRWHTTATCGTFGAAAGACKVMGLKKEAIADALGSAGTQAGGLWAFLTENAMSKQLHPAKAAFNGLFAALLAQKGFTGAKSILESEKGFFPATSEAWDVEKCLANLGQRYHFERNSLKFHASCGHTHAVVDAALSAADGRTLSACEVDRIEVSVYRAALDLLGEVKPESPYLAKFNIPFCLATALAYGHVGLDDFTDERIRNGELKDVMKKVQMDSDPVLSNIYPKMWPARVTIHLSNGETLNGSADTPKGDPENPLSPGEVMDKFQMLTGGLISPAASDSMIVNVMNLEKCEDVSVLFASKKEAS